MSDESNFGSSRITALGILQNGIALSIVGGFAIYLWRNRSLFDSLLEVSIGQIAGIAILIFTSWVLSSAQTWLMYRAEGVAIGFRENLVVTIASVLINYMPFRLGTWIRMRYLKTVHGFGYARWVGIMGTRLVLVVTATGIMGLLGTLLLWYESGTRSIELSIGFSVLIGIAIAASLLSPPLSRRESGFFRIWNEFSSGYAAMRERPRVTGGVLFLILLQLGLLAWRFDLTLDAIGIQATSGLLVVLSPATALSTFIAIVPGGLGLREAVMGSITLATGAEFNVGFFAGALDRAVLLALVLLFGTSSFYLIGSKLVTADRVRHDDA